MPYSRYIWKEAPFLRLIIPLIAGIVLQWLGDVSYLFGWTLLIVSAVFVAFLSFNSISFSFKYLLINGICVNTLMLALGMLLSYYQNGSHRFNWIGKMYKPGQTLLLKIEEPLSEKQNSFKTTASVQLLQENSSTQPLTGQVIVYFQKDSSIKALQYGSQILINKNLQPIKNSNNPGSFNYERYTAFQNIYYQLYLKSNEYVLLNKREESWLPRFIFQTRKKIVAILQQYIPGTKERGLAEALLIGYKDDMEMSLVQSYSNTGVVHIVAISGLHLGLIYWLLNLLLSPLKKRKQLPWLQPALLIIGIWSFALLAGGRPSVTRAAVMFTCIVLGESLHKPVSIYNSLASSAFILLCYNPFWLWDVGFQLSYAAVLSIVIFMKPIYNWFYVQNKLLDFVWQIMAVTLAAQLLTLPISIYHFHQFPNYFLITNLLAVPLASLILISEIVLCGFSFLPIAANYLGKLAQGLIWLLNSIVEHMERLPYSIWEGLQFSIPQLLFLYIFIGGMAWWLLKKQTGALWLGLLGLLGFVTLRSLSFYQTNQQQKIIVYNVPQHTAIDFVEGRNYVFTGDSLLKEDDFLRNFHLKPSRILHRMKDVATLPSLHQSYPFFSFREKKILLINEAYQFPALPKKIKADLVIVAKNPPLYINQLLKTVECPLIVFDASNPKWKVEKWLQACSNAGQSCFSVVDKGAFVMQVR
jgi:competence protein ComEC